MPDFNDIWDQKQPEQIPVHRQPSVQATAAYNPQAPNVEATQAGAVNPLQAVSQKVDEFAEKNIRQPGLKAMDWLGQQAGKAWNAQSPGKKTVLLPRRLLPRHEGKKREI